MAAKLIGASVLAFAANPGVIDLLACWCGAGWKRPTHSFRRDDCF